MAKMRQNVLKRCEIACIMGHEIETFIWISCLSFKKTERRAAMYTRLVLTMKRKRITVKRLSELTGIPYRPLCDKLKKKSGITIEDAFLIRTAVESDETIDTLFVWEE